MSNKYPDGGVIWMCFSEDNNMLLTLSGEIPQELSLWKWKTMATSPYYSYKYEKQDQIQHFAAFHPKDSSHFLTCSKTDAYFFKVDEGGIISSVVNLTSLYDEKACKQAGDFTQTVFSPVSVLAITGTTKGKIVLWSRIHHGKEKTDQHNNCSLTMDPKQRICLRMMQIFSPHCSITCLTICEDLIVAGNSQSIISFFDEMFILQKSIEIGKGPISAITFKYRPKYTFKEAVLRTLGKKLEKLSPLKRNDFIVCCSNGYAGYVKISSSEVTDILSGTSYAVKSVIAHPLKPYIYVGDYKGEIQKWNYNTKDLIMKQRFQGTNIQIESMTVDSSGNYIACATLNGKIAIFDALNFFSKPCFTNDINHRLTSVKFSPDPQHLIATDEAAYVYRFQLYLIVPPEVYQLIRRDNIPPEEPKWQYNGKSHQHLGKIVDCMFNNSSKGENVYFFTLGEDRFIIEYDISNSRKMEIEVIRRMGMETSCTPICMSWYPIYDILTCIAVIFDDRKLWVYNLEDEKRIKIVLLPPYEEKLKRMVLREISTDMMDSDKVEENKNSPTTDSNKLEKNKSLQETDTNKLKEKRFLKYFIFYTTCSIGLVKYPVDGNPYGSIALATHPKGIHKIAVNKEQTFLFTAGKKDSWIYIALMKLEQEGEQGLDAFKSLLPANEDPEEMKKRLIYSVYSIEAEIKMLKLGGGQESMLKGEIPINCLEYVLSALGCFLSSNELQLMLDDINFENEYLHKGEELTLNCLDIMKLYVNYRPKEFLTKESISNSFEGILSSEEDPDKISRSRFIEILETGGDPLAENELITIVKCLKDAESTTPSINKNKEVKLDSNVDVSENLPENDIEDPIIPEVITEKVFLQDILCIKKAPEVFRNYFVRGDDLKLKQQPLKVEDFLKVVKENNMLQDFESS
ncbi:WD repeat-containing protein 66 [Caerostris darwini]|uniref:Cilia- and flagella-associated protein 251 n=1 Tax=Caerostris darwini TaxID=1538125 RepID=A0AAV4NP14_9ARAC|nr:WD repeat-containing protein 66 [Caerostris darwini]